MFMVELRCDGWSNGPVGVNHPVLMKGISLRWLRTA